MVNSSQIMQMLMLNTVGMSVLTETLKMAAQAVFVDAQTSPTESQKCYLFIQGTGLDKMLMKFDLAYDPEALRMSFNYYYRHKDEERNYGICQGYFCSSS